MATLHQNLVNSSAGLPQASLNVEYHVSPTLAYVLNFITHNGAVPNSSINPLEYLGILENIGVQLHAHNAAKICAVDSVAWENMSDSDRQTTIMILDEITHQACVALRDDSCPSRFYIGPKDTLQFVDPITARNAKLPRPPNPFIIYRSERHQSVKEAYPDAKNNDISKILGKQWQGEPDDVRIRYKQKSEEIKEEFMRLYPDYKYKPRKSSDVKRRSRRNPENSP
ncbi:hypothetical protein Daus18300_009953 [Diaporthe australafricana]|uniref:HMG box domain-containing protein n=3 Tax=Diaporthaceae TaxID=767018 RepID=A0ABR3WCH6_9PEZI